MKKILPLILVGLLASILIFYKFPNLPKYLASDEVDFARLAFSLENKPYTPYSQLATGHSTLYFYILLASLKTFGANIFALRFPAAIFGLSSVIIFYLIMRKVFQSSFAKASAFDRRSQLRPTKSVDKQYFPFLFSFILLSSRWFLNFARFSFEVTFLLFLELTSIYFFIKAQMPVLSKSPGAPLGCGGRKNMASSFYLIMSGFFAGLAFLSYTPGRIFFLLPLSFLGLKLINSLIHKQFNKEVMKQLLLFLIPFLIVITPLTLYFSTHTDTRINQQFFLMNHKMPINEKIGGLWSNISSTTLMFFTKGDMNGRHNYPGKPALNPILGILLIIGIITTIKSVFVKTTTDKQWNNNINKFFVLYFLLSILPALMTYPWENPNMLRTYTCLPSIVFFIGQGIIVLFLFFSHKFKKYVQIICLVIIGIICLSSAYEMHTYFIYQPLAFKNSFNQPDYLPIIYKNAQNQQK